MLYRISFLIAILVFEQAFPQEIKEKEDFRPRNSVNINLLGDASLYSINYERFFYCNEVFVISSKVGLGYNTDFFLPGMIADHPGPENYLTIPYHITWNFGDNRHFFEFGMGGAMIEGEILQPYFVYPIFGYRMIPLPNKRINFRTYIQLPISGFQDISFYPDIEMIFSPIGFNLGVGF